jgi:hypothetical protein
MDPARFAHACDAVSQAARNACGDSVRAILVHGSAWKGGFFPPFSDFDAQLFLDRACMEGPLTPLPETAIALQRELGPLDPATFAISQFQVFAVNADDLPPEWEAPVPGSYRMLTGEPPAWPEGGPAPMARARDRLVDARRVAAGLLRSFQDKSDGRAANSVRLGGTAAKGLLPHAAIALGAPATVAWTWGLSRLLGDLPLPFALREEAADFFLSVDPWLEVREDPGKVRRLFGAVHRLLLTLADCAA